MSKVFGPTMEELLGTLEDQGVAPDGPVFAHHLSMGRDTFDYEGLPGAWGEFDEWIAEQGHTKAPDLWESYIEGPHTMSDPSAWRTQLKRRLVDVD